MSIDIIGMQTAEGILKAAVLPQQAAYVRKTNLDPAWTRVRLALVFSFRGLDEAEPVEEWLGSGGGQPTKIHIGLSNGAGNPGASGAKFIGITNKQQYTVGLYKYSGMWRINCVSTITSSRFVPFAANGNTSILNTQLSLDLACGAATPTGATNHAFGLMADIYRYGAGQMTTYLSGLENVTLPLQNRVGIILSNLLASAYSQSGTIDSGGWWSPATPTDCTHLYVHFPWSANRLVIHGVQVVRLS